MCCCYFEMKTDWHTHSESHKMQYRIEFRHLDECCLYNHLSLHFISSAKISKAKNAWVLSLSRSDFTNH